jgi:Tol biopolymer transport system component
MTLDDRFGRTVSDWLREQAGHGTPGYLDETLARTIRTRQHATWSSLERWLPMDLTANARVAARPTLGKALLVGAVLSALIGLALVAAGTQPRRVPPPFGLAENGRIAYWANGDIFVADADGTDEHVVVGGASEDVAPLFSRGGDSMAFWRMTGDDEAMLMLAGADGSSVRAVLPRPLRQPDWFEWSPDDAALAIVHTVENRRVLSIVDVGAGAIRTLDLDGIPVDNAVFWRPGTADELVFSSHYGLGNSAHAAIYSVHADGSRLTTIAPQIVAKAEYFGLDLAPDGRSLTYWREGIRDRARIHRLDLETRGDEELRFDPTDLGEINAVHSPDGSKLVFHREDWRAQLMIAPSDASRQGVLIGPTFGLDSNVAYGWSPDGTKVFLRTFDGTPTFFDAETGQQVPGPATPSECCTWQRRAR